MPRYKKAVKGNVSLGVQSISFPDEGRARDWMYDKLKNEEFFDNYRFAFKDDHDQAKAYERARFGGCCGFFDREIIVAGRDAMIGCNFGH